MGYVEETPHTTEAGENAMDYILKVTQEGIYTDYDRNPDRDYIALMEMLYSPDFYPGIQNGAWKFITENRAYTAIFELDYEGMADETTQDIAPTLIPTTVSETDTVTFHVENIIRFTLENEGIKLYNMSVKVSNAIPSSINGVFDPHPAYKLLVERP